MARLEQPIRIVSDLHLGSPSSHIGDVATLAPLIEGARTVIFNGDTREDRVAAVKEQAGESYHQLVELCATLGVEPVFLCGNHDPDISEHHYLDLCGGRFFVTHGDLIFPTVTPWSYKIETISEEIEQIRKQHGVAADTDLTLAVERLKETRQRISVELIHAPGGGRLERLLSTMAELWPPGRLLRILSIWRQTPHLAREFLRTYRPQAECIIIGHTHRSQRLTDQSPYLVNTGAFSAGLGLCVAEIEDDCLWTRGVRFRSGGSWRLAKRRRALGG